MRSDRKHKGQAAQCPNIVPCSTKLLVVNCNKNNRNLKVWHIPYTCYNIKLKLAFTLHRACNNSERNATLYAPGRNKTQKMSSQTFVCYIFDNFVSQLYRLCFKMANTRLHRIRTRTYISIWRMPITVTSYRDRNT